jgi:hypothetical protein
MHVRLASCRPHLCTRSLLTHHMGTFPVHASEPLPQHLVGVQLTGAAVCFGAWSWLCLSLFGLTNWARARFRSEVDGFAPQTKHVNLRIVCQPKSLSLAVSLGGATGVHV